MSTMAVPPPPLLRLFRRLDYALPPAREEFALLIEKWRAACGGMPVPRLSAVAGVPSESRSSFLFQAIEGERDYILIEGQSTAEALLGSMAADRRLSHVGNRRTAARMRRLFAEARRAGAPFVAQFIAKGGGLGRATVEALIAPLSSDGTKVDCVLGASTVQPYAPALVTPAQIDHGFSLFALGATRVLGETVARILGAELAPHEERAFEDGEFKIRPLASVRNRDVFVISSLYGDTGLSGADKLCRLLFFIGALKDAGAGRVTVVAPYLCFQRKDRQTKPRDPVATRYVAQLLEAMGTDRVIAVEPHNLPAFQNAFRCDTDYLHAQTLFARHFVGLVGDADVAVVSPDLGGEKRADLFRERLEKMLARPVAKAFMDKRRSEGKVAGDIFAGDVDRRIAIVFDDLISGGGTMARVAEACRRHGATQVWCVATHGVFSQAAPATLERAPIDRIVITDSVPAPTFMERSELRSRMEIVSIAGLLAQAIKCCHCGGSIVRLLEEGT
jgi:ribose-phosphate pyrophosphokinase